MNDRLQDLVMPIPFSRSPESRRSRQSDNLLNLLANALGLSRRQIDLVNDRNDFEIVLRARYVLASVCASTPCEASTTSSVPSQACRLRETS